MPIHKQGSGWQWGNHGKVYPTREDAEKQAAAAHAHGYTGDSMASRAAISKKIAEEIEKGHDPKQAVAIAYSELGEDMSPEDWAGLTDGLMKFFAEEQKEPEHAKDSENTFSNILGMLVGKLNEEDFAQFAVALKNYFPIATDGGPGSK